MKKTLKLFEAPAVGRRGQRLSPDSFHYIAQRANEGGGLTGSVTGDCDLGQYGQCYRVINFRVVGGALVADLATADTVNGVLLAKVLKKADCSVWLRPFGNEMLRNHRVIGYELTRVDLHLARALWMPKLIPVTPNIRRVLPGLTTPPVQPMYPICPGGIYSNLFAIRLSLKGEHRVVETS